LSRRAQIGLLGARLLVACVALAGSAAGGQPAVQPPGMELLPEGDGRIEVYAHCQPCHSLHIVAQQRLSRDGWVEALEWMVEEQGMPPLPAQRRDLVLDYLVEHFAAPAQ
jgi:hypothetical protein